MATLHNITITEKITKADDLIELTPEKLKNRLNEGFCPYCQDKDGVKHQCVQPCNFVIMQEANNLAEGSIETEGNTKGEEGVITDQEEECSFTENMEVSVHAIEGVHSNKTITLTGRRGKQQFAILIDGGSTHSLLDETTAGKLKCELVKTQPMKVQVANGNHLESLYECKEFKWKIGDNEFQTAVRCLPMGEYDLVLGVDWLGSLGLVTFDYKKLTLQFQRNGQVVVLQGNTQTTRPKLQQMTAKAFVRSCQRQGNGFIYLVNEVCSG